MLAPTSCGSIAATAAILPQVIGGESFVLHQNTLQLYSPELLHVAVWHCIVTSVRQRKEVVNIRENLGLALAAATLVVNLWMAIQNRKPKKPGKHRKKR